MKNKIISIVVCTLLIATAMIIVPIDFKVKATGGGGEDGSIGLDYEFMWNVTKELADVVHDPFVYPSGTIPKGRAFGTKGDNHTANYILKPYMESEEYCGLSDVDTLPIGYINKIKHFWKQYSSKIVVKDFSLSLTHPDKTYPFQTPMEKTELYPFPSGYHYSPILPVTHYYNFTNVKIHRMYNPDENRNENWPWGGTYNNYHFNITCNLLNNNNMVIGNVSLIENGSSMPSFQDGMIFILNESEECVEKIENMTNASGCILIHNKSRGYNYSSATDYNFPIIKVNDTNNNFSAIFEKLENKENMFVDNALDDNIITFTYNLSVQNCLPNSDYMFLKNIREGANSYVDLGIAKNKSIICYFLNFIPILSRCHGIILYDSFDTHFMSYAIRRWTWFGGAWMTGPALPMFSVNYSVGNWLWENATCSTGCPNASGYLDQENKKQTPSKPGIDAYNVVGYKNITQSPDDKIAIISNRYDGMWGETPGDSGTGAGVVLAIAKYMNDYNIKPKYNLTFLMTTGEEYGMRGAVHFRDKMSQYLRNKTAFWIGTDQLAMNQENLTLNIGCGNTVIQDIVWEISNETNYNERNQEKNYSIDPENKKSLEVLKLKFGLMYVILLFLVKTGQVIGEGIIEQGQSILKEMY